MAFCGSCIKKKKSCPHYPWTGKGERPEGKKKQAEQKVWALLNAVKLVDLLTPLKHVSRVKRQD